MHTTRRGGRDRFRCRSRYQGGRANYLDVLTAQRSLFESELSLARTRRMQLTSVVQLYKALGGGWSPDMAGNKEESVGTSGNAVESFQTIPMVSR